MSTATTPGWQPLYPSPLLLIVQLPILRPSSTLALPHTLSWHCPHTNKLHLYILSPSHLTHLLLTLMTARGRRIWWIFFLSYKSLLQVWTQSTTISTHFNFRCLPMIRCLLSQVQTMVRDTGWGLLSCFDVFSNGFCKGLCMCNLYPVHVTMHEPVFLQHTLQRIIFDIVKFVKMHHVLLHYTSILLLHGMDWYVYIRFVYRSDDW